MFKSLWAAIKVFLKGVLHVILIPVLAALKAIDTGCQHLITELSKV